MVFFNHVARQMAAKIVYYGPAFSGKTTNLQYIHAKTADNMRGEMVSLETETDRTIFFDLLPIIYGDFQGYQTRFLLYTVPGQVYYNNTRKLVLQGADGIVFVADSQLMDENVEALKNLRENLAEMDIDLDSIPLVFQYNKRDLKKVHSMKALQGALNPTKRPHLEATALYGPGVFETLKTLSTLTLEGLTDKLQAPAPRAVSQTTPKTPPKDKSKAPPKATPRKKATPKAAPRKKATPKAAPQTTRTAPPKSSVKPGKTPAGQKQARPSPEDQVAALTVDFDHAPSRKRKAQRTQVEYTRIALSDAKDIDRELDRLRKITFKRSREIAGDTTQELPPATIDRVHAKLKAAAEKPRILAMPIDGSELTRVKSVKIQVILEGEKLSRRYRKAYRVAIPRTPRKTRTEEVGFRLDVKIRPE